MNRRAFTKLLAAFAAAPVAIRSLPEPTRPLGLPWKRDEFLDVSAIPGSLHGISVGWIGDRPFNYRSIHLTHYENGERREYVWPASALRHEVHIPAETAAKMEPWWAALDRACGTKAVRL